MTIEERQQAAMEAIKSIEVKFGLRITATATIEAKLVSPDVCQTAAEAHLGLQAIDGWAEPTPNGAEKVAHG